MQVVLKSAEHDVTDFLKDLPSDHQIALEVAIDKFKAANPRRRTLVLEVDLLKPLLEYMNPLCDKFWPKPGKQEPA